MHMLCAQVDVLTSSMETQLEESLSAAQVCASTVLCVVAVWDMVLCSVFLPSHTNPIVAASARVFARLQLYIQVSVGATIPNRQSF
jgi:hypothetical protein